MKLAQWWKELRRKSKTKTHGSTNPSCRPAESCDQIKDPIKRTDTSSTMVQDPPEEDEMLPPPVADDICPVSPIYEEIPAIASRGVDLNQLAFSEAKQYGSFVVIPLKNHDQNSDYCVKKLPDPQIKVKTDNDQTQLVAEKTRQCRHLTSNPLYDVNHALSDYEVLFPKAKKRLKFLSEKKENRNKKHTVVPQMAHGYVNDVISSHLPDVVHRTMMTPKEPKKHREMKDTYEIYSSWKRETVSEEKDLTVVPTHSRARHKVRHKSNKGYYNLQYDQLFPQIANKNLSRNNYDLSGTKAVKPGRRLMCFGSDVDLSKTKETDTMIMESYPLERRSTSECDIGNYKASTLPHMKRSTSLITYSQIIHKKTIPKLKRAVSLISPKEQTKLVNISQSDLPTNGRQPRHNPLLNDLMRINHDRQIMNII